VRLLVVGFSQNCATFPLCTPRDEGLRTDRSFFLSACRVLSAFLQKPIKFSSSLVATSLLVSDPLERIIAPRVHRASNRLPFLSSAAARKRVPPCSSPPLCPWFEHPSYYIGFRIMPRWWQSHGRQPRGFSVATDNSPVAFFSILMRRGSKIGNLQGSRWPRVPPLSFSFPFFPAMSMEHFLRALSCRRYRPFKRRSRAHPLPAGQFPIRSHCRCKGAAPALLSRASDALGPPQSLSRLYNTPVHGRRIPVQGLSSRKKGTRPSLPPHLNVSPISLAPPEPRRKRLRLQGNLLPHNLMFTWSFLIDRIEPSPFFPYRAPASRVTSRFQRASPGLSPLFSSP